ncbi:hypothetical protein KC951_02995 [Candidatus Saccharibacteria bacterium]|nr:hypothetical protein [Candidatus Saccharibacteria bacterium]
MSRQARRITSVALTALIAGVLIFGWWQRQAAYDWWRLRGYQPSPEIAQIAANTTMTDLGKRLFYVAHPSLSDQATFNQNCNISEFSIILGCYISGGNIYVYDVSDERLAGIHEVTAAHEMLHVAYERLSDAERERVDTLLIDAYNNLKDERIKTTIAQYEAADPSSVPNELHSILGTEVRNLSPELEEYYKQYFDDRSVVVAYSEHYEHEFAARRAQVVAYDVQLETLKQQIESNQSALYQRRAMLESTQNQLNQLRINEQYSLYNAQVDSYNAAVNAYNDLVATTKAQIEQYNTIVAARNALAVEVQQLVEALDSTPQSIQ